MKPGEIVQTTRRIKNGAYTVKRGTRGRVLSVDGDTILVELPDGGRFEAQVSDAARLLRQDVEFV